MLKKIFATLLLTSIFLLVSQPAFATNISGPAPHFVSEDNIEVTHEVNGDTFLVGQNIVISESINGDLFIIGDKVSISAPINGDLRIIASSIDIKSYITGSLAFISEKTLINSIGEIEKDAYGITSKFNLYGRIGGDLNLGYSENSEILVDGKVLGNIHYLDKLPSLTKDAFLGGEIIKTSTPNFESTQENRRLQIIIQKIFHSLSLIFIAFIVIKLPKNIFVKGFESYKKTFKKNLLLGLFYMLIIPLILIALTISIIGIPVALIAFAELMFLIYISPIYVGTFIGSKILPNSKSILLQTICGIFIFDAISMGPIIGSLLYLISIIVFLGFIIKTFLGLYAGRKTRK